MNEKVPYPKYPENSQPIDLVYTDWRWVFYDDHYWEQLARPRPRLNNEEIDATAPYMVKSPGSHAKYTTPLTEGGNPSKDEPVLFRHFADMGTTPNDYLDFANHYGHLGNTFPLWYENDENKVVWGESLLYWRREQWLLKNCIRLWEWIRSNNLNKLSLVSEWVTENDYTYIKYQLGSEKEISIYKKGTFAWHGQKYIIGTSHMFFFQDSESKDNTYYYILHGDQFSAHEILKVAPLGDVRLPAIQLLQSIINGQLLEYRTNPLIYFDQKAQCFKQQLFPTNLIGVMWLQLSKWVTGERKIKQCPICRHWADVTNIKGSWLKHRECANWDRVTKLRKFEKVKSLYTSGSTIEDISKEINVESSHIRRWLSEEFGESEVE